MFIAVAGSAVDEIRKDLRRVASGSLIFRGGDETDGSTVAGDKGKGTPDPPEREAVVR